MRKLIYSLLWAVCGMSAAPAQAQHAFRVMEYNVENLFDCRHDSLKQDTEFLPGSVRNWMYRRFQDKVNKIGKVILAAGKEQVPDLVGLCEVENDYCLKSLTRYSPLREVGYKYVMTSSPDERGIDVALLYQPVSFRLLASQKIRIPSDSLGMRPTRDVLYVSGRVVSGDTLDVFVCHLPSRVGGAKKTDPYRLWVARRIRQAADSSFLFWVLQSLNEEVEASFKIPIRFTNVPDKVMITNEYPQYLDIRIRDNGTTMMNYMIDRFVPVEIDFNQYQNKRGQFTISLAKLSTLVRKQLKNTTGLVSISPDSLTLYYSQNKGAKFKLRLVGSVSTIPQCVINGEISSGTDSVTVYAPSYILNSIKTIETDSFALRNLSDTTVYDLPLKKIRGAKIVPDKVKIMVPVEEITMKKMTLAVKIENIPDNMTMLLFPATVEVSYMLPISHFAKVTAGDIEIGVDYGQIKNNSGNKLAVKVLKQPSFVKHLQVVPDSIEYILEEKVL